MPSSSSRPPPPHLFSCLPLCLPPIGSRYSVYVYISCLAAMVSGISHLPCTMNSLHVLVLLASVVLLCRAAPVLEPVTCSEDNATAAAALSVHVINEHHNHGYKFRLSEIKGKKVEQVDDGCTIELQLDLVETICHTVNPRCYEDCPTRIDSERVVMANCTVMITVQFGDAKVPRYYCDTRQAKTDEELMCPDCPTLISLKDPQGLKSVEKATEEVNMNTTNEHYYALLEVGRMISGYMPSEGMFYVAEFVLVETHCLKASKIVVEACQPLCPDRAHHAFCISDFSNGAQLKSVKCEYFPPSNTTALGPGEMEPNCGPMHLPPLAGPPSPASPSADKGTGPANSERGMLFVKRHCIGVFPNSYAALHPICPMPLPEPYPNPKADIS